MSDASDDISTIVSENTVIEPKTKRKPKEKAVRAKKEVVVEDELVQKKRLLDELQAKRALEIELNKKIKNEKAKLDRKKGAVITNKKRAETAKKAELFDRFLEGNLDYEQVLLAGYKPKTTEKVTKAKAPKQVEPKEKSIRQLRADLGF